MDKEIVETHTYKSHKILKVKMDSYNWFNYTIENYTCSFSTLRDAKKYIDNM